MYGYENGGLAKDNKQPKMRGKIRSKYEMLK